MANSTPSMAKNKIERSLRQIIYRYPNATQKKKVWQYFDNSCAYCGQTIDPNGRQGHLDHLISISDGGTNDIHNFVLACHICNGDEKRESDWQDFLKSKCSDTEPETYAIRLEKIEAWHAHTKTVVLNESQQQQIDDIILQAKRDFDDAVHKMRKLRDAINETS